MFNHQPELTFPIYVFNEHKLRFAVWIVCRSQRSFTTNDRIKAACGRTGLRPFSECNTLISQDEFDDTRINRNNCNWRIEHFGN